MARLGVVQRLDARGHGIRERRIQRPLVRTARCTRVVRKRRSRRGAAPEILGIRERLTDELGAPDPTVDLDEAQTWEMLNGSDKDVAFDIPLHRVAAIARHGVDGSVVTLAGGETLRLAAGQDVSEDNAGVLVLGAAAGDARYIPWADVTEIRFASGH